MAFSVRDIAAEAERMFGSSLGSTLGGSVQVVSTIQEGLQDIEAFFVAEGDIECEYTANKVKTESQLHVPYKTGELHGSALVRQGDSGRPQIRVWEVAYESSYAKLIHENPFHRQYVQPSDPEAATRPGYPMEGEKWSHFLTLAAESEAPGMQNRMRKRIASAAKKAEARASARVAALRAAIRPTSTGPRLRVRKPS